MDALLKDLGYALRSLRKHPAFAVTAIVTLALGIGSSTAIFSVVNAVLLRPLPYPKAEQLVLIWGELRARKLNNFPFSPPDYQDLKSQTTSFQDIAGLFSFRGQMTVDADKPEQVKVMGVTPNLTALLGAHVVLGRDFTDADAFAPPAPPPPAPGAAPVAPPAPLPGMVVLTNAFWQRRFGGASRVIGQSIDFGGNPAMIVGVLSPGFEALFPPNTNIEAHPDM